MKRLILHPQKDTVTICLPADWVGKPLICTLDDSYIQEDTEVVSQVSDVSIIYQAKRCCAKHRKPRRRRLRKRNS